MSARESPNELNPDHRELVFRNNEKDKHIAMLILENDQLKEGLQRATLLNEKTEQKIIKRDEQLESVNQELKSFSYSVAHDLRSPLRAVHGYTQILKEDYGAKFDEEGNRVMNNIMNGAKKIGQLIDGLLAVSKVGQSELTAGNISMNKLVSSICNEAKRELGERQIQFKVDELPSATGDGNAIRTVWENLISNAIKFSRSKQPTIIEIGYHTSEKEIAYHIKDNGVGFDMHYANKLFGVFQRLHTIEQFEGIGVGLAIVYRIISRHGGRVWADATIDEGATFYFSLPRNQAI